MRKELFLSLLILCFLAFFTQNTTFAQTGDIYCDDIIIQEGGNCNGWTYVTNTLFISSAYYNGCDCTIGYWTRSCTIPAGNGCPSKTITQIKLSSIDWDWENCGITSFLYPGYPNDFSILNYENFKLFCLDIQRCLGIDAFDSFYNELSDLDKPLYKCLEPNCSQPICSVFELSYSNPKCMSVCETRTAMKMKYTFLSCQPLLENCCKNTYKMCYCANTGEVYVEETITSLGDRNCGATAPPIGVCNQYGNPNHPTENYSILRDCTAFCE